MKTVGRKLIGGYLCEHSNRCVMRGWRFVQPMDIKQQAVAKIVKRD
jgi:hypothetical protein